MQNSNAGIGRDTTRWSIHMAQGTSEQAATVQSPYISRFYNSLCVKHTLEQMHMLPF